MPQCAFVTSNCSCTKSCLEREAWCAGTLQWCHVWGLGRFLFSQEVPDGQSVPFLEELALEIASALVDSEVDGYEVRFLWTGSLLLWSPDIRVITYIYLVLYICLYTKWCNYILYIHNVYMYIWFIVTLVYSRTHRSHYCPNLASFHFRTLEHGSLNLKLNSSLVTWCDPTKGQSIGKWPLFPGSFLMVGGTIKLRQIGSSFQQETKEMIPWNLFLLQNETVLGCSDYLRQSRRSHQKPDRFYVSIAAASRCESVAALNELLKRFGQALGISSSLGPGRRITFLRSVDVGHMKFLKKTELVIRLWCS